MMINKKTRLKFSAFYDSKNGRVEPTCEIFHCWKQEGKPVVIVRQVNAGENKLLQSRCDSAEWKFGIAFEYTAQDTPQQNHLAELAFATVINKARAMMWQLLLCLWWCAINHGKKPFADLDGLLLVTLSTKVATKYEHAFGKNQKFAAYLRTWGEAGSVKTKGTGTPKLADCGAICISIGYMLRITRAAAISCGTY
jgi:hypothetical protein